MAGNQREIQRREKKAQKDKRNKRIIWIVIAVVVAILAIMKISEVNINSIKHQFTGSDGSFSINNSSIDGNFPFNLDSSTALSFNAVNNKLGVLTPNSLTILDNNDANVEYSFDHGYSNPIMESSGPYTLVYDQGGTAFRLDSTSKSYYESTTERVIHCADVSKNGTIAYATTSSEKKSQIVVVNKSLKKLLTYDVSYGYVVAIAINDGGNKIAFSCVNSENAKLKFKLYTMNVGASDVKAELDLPSGNLIDLKYSSSNLYVVGDNYLGVVSNQKKYQEVFKAGDINTVKLCYTPSNDLLLVYNKYANSTDNTLARIIASGKVRKDVKVSGNIKSISSSSSVVSILTGNSIVSYNLGNFKEKSKRPVDDSAKAICQMGTQIYVHRQSLIDRNEGK